MGEAWVELRPGDYTAVDIVGHGASTLYGVAVGRTSLTEFARLHGATIAAPDVPGGGSGREMTA